MQERMLARRSVCMVTSDLSEWPTGRWEGKPLVDGSEKIDSGVRGVLRAIYRERCLFWFYDFVFERWFGGWAG